MAGTQLFFAAVGVQPASQIGPLAVGALAHGGAAVGALHQPGQQVGLAGAVGPGAQLEGTLDGIEGGPVDDGLVGALHPIPLAFRGVDDDLGLVAYLFSPPLNHHPGVHLIGKDAAHRHLVPQAEVVLHGMVAAPAPLRLVAGGVGDALLVEQVGDVLASMALQRQLEDLPHHLRRLRVGNDVVFVCRVLPVAVDGKASDVLALPPLQIEHHTNIFGQVLQIPLVYQAVDLAGLFVALHLGVGIVRHCDEPDPPEGNRPWMYFSTSSMSRVKRDWDLHRTIWNFFCLAASIIRLKPGRSLSTPEKSSSQ